MTSTKPKGRKYMAPASIAARFGDGALREANLSRSDSRIVAETLDELDTAIPDASPQQRIVMQVLAVDLRRFQRLANEALEGKAIDLGAYALHRDGILKALKLLGMARRTKAAGWRTYLESKTSPPAASSSGEVSPLPAGSPAPLGDGDES